MIQRIQPDPQLDLLLERDVDVPRELVWRAWTEPELLKQWFTPKPWSTVDCTLDLRPGGAFDVVMQSPEGQKFPYDGCYLEVIPGERLIWTSALIRGYRPAKLTESLPFFLTAVLSLESRGKGTHYTALVKHNHPDDRQKHAEMGFQDGWGTALDQLVALAKTMKL